VCVIPPLRAKNKHHEQDHSHRRMGEKILISRLKQEALRRELEGARSKVPEEGAFAATFSAVKDNAAVAPSTSQLTRTGTADFASSHAVSIEPADDAADSEEVQWEDGYTGMRQKPLGSDSDGAGSESDGSGDSFDWDIPLDSDQIDVTVLASLPVQMRKDLIEETRKRERLRKRTDYIPVAADPQLYSQTQIANFLRTRWEPCGDA
jgi:hypothetical protein